eukprot:3011231-Amphidinium_carterae.2
MTGKQSLWCYNRSDKPATKLFYKGLVDIAEDTFEVLNPAQPDLALEEFAAGLTFHVSSSYAFREICHINKQELLAWRTSLRHGVERGFLVHTRCCFLIDSQVIVNILRKGRSSSKSLNACLITALPWQVLARATCLPMWVQSKANPADDPTRHCRLRDAVQSGEAVRNAVASISQDCPWLWHVCTDLWRDSPGVHAIPECVVDKWVAMVTALLLVSVTISGCEHGVSSSCTREVVLVAACMCLWRSCVRVLGACFDCTLGYEGEGPPPRATLRHQDLQEGFLRERIAI